MSDNPMHPVDPVCLEAMAANERMGAALAYIYREAPEWKQRVADYLADYPFDWPTPPRGFDNER